MTEIVPVAVNPAKSRLPPPLPCFAGIVVGALLQWFAPWPIARQSIALTIGFVLLAGAVVLLAALHREFRRHDTPPDPVLETTAIIDTGPFRYSRNPVYVAFALLEVALGFLFNNAWIVLLTVPAVWAMHRFVVLREEAYLDAKFGDTYRQYRARVRRWI
jgi:protein-S-isoprenylcysteine O-methyltransferase Ste14